MSGPYHGRGASRNIALAPDDPGLAGDAEALLFEWAYTGEFPRANVVYIVPEGRSLIVKLKGLVGTSHTTAMRELLLEIGDPLADGKFIVIEPLWKARAVLNQKFDWGLDAGPSQQWRVK